MTKRSSFKILKLEEITLSTDTQPFRHCQCRLNLSPPLIKTFTDGNKAEVYIPFLYMHFISYIDTNFEKIPMNPKSGP